ncbi:hypothetical protein MC885_006507 [Smutsia gigantea]|nr:hypothetical protein MC885_006507 [Smutsia gigantea]
MSPRAELRPEKKPGHRPRSQRDDGPQKELMIPGIVDLELNREALKTPKPQTPTTYRFGRLSHHSFFSRHHPHPQRVTHIQEVLPAPVIYGLWLLEKVRPVLSVPTSLLLASWSLWGSSRTPSHSLPSFTDLTGKPVCVVRDEFSLAALPQATLLSRCLMGIPTISVPVGDPQSNRDPWLFSDAGQGLGRGAGSSTYGHRESKEKGPRYQLAGSCPLLSEAWKKELKDLASRVATFTKQNELKNKEQKEEPQRAKYSAETGRLIPAPTHAIGRYHSRQARQNYPSGRAGGVQTFILQDQELLILELLCQILQTDSLNAIQFWLLYAPPKEKDLALGLLQTAVAQFLPQPLVSIPAEKLRNQLQKAQESPQERQQPLYSQSPKKMKTPPLPKSEKPENIGKAQVLRLHSNHNTEEKTSKLEC